MEQDHFQHTPESFLRPDMVRNLMRTLSFNLQRIFDDIQKVEKECKQLAELLQQDTTGMLKEPVRLTESEMLVEVLKTRKHAATLSEIITLLTSQYPDFMPMQIINVKSFVLRRLEKACTEGKIIELSGLHKAHIYALPNWLQEEGKLAFQYDVRHGYDL